MKKHIIKNNEKFINVIRVPFNMTNILLMLIEIKQLIEINKC